MKNCNFFVISNVDKDKVPKYVIGIVRGPKILDQVEGTTRTTDEAEGTKYRMTRT